MTTSVIDSHAQSGASAAAVSGLSGGGAITAALSVVPGLLLTSGIAAAAFGLHALPGISSLSPMILSIFIGIAFHNLVRTPAWAKPGVVFSLRRILRLAIILLGLQLTAQQVVAVGGTGLAVIVATLLPPFCSPPGSAACSASTRKLTQLIAAGTSICGASAVIATNTVTDGSDEDVAYAVACVTVFGSIAMFPIRCWSARCTWTRMPMAYGPAARSTRSPRWSPPPIRTAPRPANSAPSPSSPA